MERLSGKVVLRGGCGVRSPKLLDRAEVDVEGKSRLADDTEQVVYKKKEVVEIGQSYNELSSILEDMVCTMKVGEICSFSSDPMVYTVHLVSLCPGKDLWEVSDEERLDLAIQHKTAGTQYFREKNISGAAMHYSRAMKYLIPVEPNTDSDLQESIEKLKWVILLNLAACQLQFGQYHLAQSNCSEVLYDDHCNVKALFRRAQACIAMNDFEQARMDLTKAKELVPTNHSIDEQLKTLTAKETTHRKQYHNALRKMFN